MKNKFFFLTAAIASCVISATAAPAYPMQNINGGRSCYDRNMCTGSPNSWGGGVCGNQVAPGTYAVQTNSYGYREAGQDGTGKVLQTESTENFVGIIKSVNKVALPNQTQIQVILETSHGDLLVIVGPAQFVDQARIKLQAGDKVTVTGYRIKANGNDVIIAAEIKGNKGGSIQLLDENRQPIWGGKAGEYRQTNQYGSQSTYSQPAQYIQNNQRAQNSQLNYQNSQRNYQGSPYSNYNNQSYQNNNQRVQNSQGNYQGSPYSTYNNQSNSSNYSGSQNPNMPNSRY